MARNFGKLPSWSNVAAGNTATFEQPLGRTYDKLHIRVNVNGRTFKEFKDGHSLQDKNKY